MKAFFVPPFYGVNIRVDNRIRKNCLKPDKKLRGFLKCNREMFDMLKNHPEMKMYKFYKTKEEAESELLER